MASFMKASELLISKNNTVILDELKEKLSHIENAQLSEIYKEPSKSSTFKETYNHPCIETLQKYATVAKPKNTQQNTRLWFSRFDEFVKNTQPAIDLLTLYDKKVIALLLCEFIIVIKTRENKEYKANSLYNGICAINRFYQEIFKTNESFNIHEDHEFRSVRDTLHARMIELEEINNGNYNGADPLTNEEMIQIFENPDMSNNMPDGLLKRVFLWVGCCTARRGGSYHNIMAEHFKERDDGGFNVITIHDKTHQGGYYHKTNSNQHPIHIIPPDEIGVHGACCDIKKYLKLRPRNAEANFFLRINKDPKEIENGNWYTTSHMGRDKLSGMLKEICNITGIDCTNKRIVNHSLRKYTAQKLNDEGLDSQAIMNVTLHRSLAGLNAYRKQNEKQKLTIAKLTLPSVSKDVPENFNTTENSNAKKSNAKENLNEAAISNAEEIDISSETEREPLSEIQNTVPSKRKNDLLFNNSKLKFIKCKNITINITK
ncbi:unnamed protein product [Rhizophagus irregularis]|nr:unnamed protein product [Rhizophagus irregularis]CAB5374821.1 unnamed protein product [Rhizophagus irregularis]